MEFHSNFWVTLNNLASDLEVEGKTDAERIAKLTMVFHALSEASQVTCQQNIKTALGTLHGLAEACWRAGDVASG
jgi:hypothetical protein